MPPRSGRSMPSGSPVRSALSAARRKRRRRSSASRRGRGRSPQALSASAGSTLRAAEMFHEHFPDEPLTVLVDYFGQETSDAVAVCRRVPELAAASRLAFRMDTPGGRYCEGLDLARSYDVLERHAPQSIRGYRTEAEL